MIGCMGMGTLNSNKQSMKYVLEAGEEPVYEHDSDGNVVYVEVNGEQLPVETGKTEMKYSVPQDFKANISENGGKAEAREFGIDVSDYDAIILTRKNEFPISESSYIWSNRPVGYKDKEHVDVTTADYRVVSVKNSLFYTHYLVKRNV